MELGHDVLPTELTPFLQSHLCGQAGEEDSVVLVCLPAGHGHGFEATCELGVRIKCAQGAQGADCNHRDLQFVRQVLQAVHEHCPLINLAGQDVLDLVHDQHAGPQSLEVTQHLLKQAVHPGAGGEGGADPVEGRSVEASQVSVGKQFAKVTVGTVHSLQGAEKPIVVFSPTYGADTAKGLFFDRKPNMLNVAVSRAKDSFVVIGDMRLFRRSGRSPSSILGNMLFADDQNELPDVDGNYRFPREILVQGERISTLDRHRQVLRAALTEATAGQVVVIASPWITMKAIEADGLAALVAGAVQERGATVRIIVDRELSARDPKHRAAEAIAEMKKAGAVVSTIGNMHNKTLIIGPSEIAEGSFNWLSANRLREDRHLRHETSWRISGQAAISAVQSALEEFTKLGA